MGVLVPYWSPYLRSLGFSAARIGELTAVFMAARIVAPLLMGFWADKTGRPMLMVRVSSFLAAAFFALVFVDQSYWILAFATAGFGLFYASGIPAFEAVTLNHLGGGEERYGRIRLWGSWGFIFSVVLIGRFLENSGMGAVPPILQALFVLSALFSIPVPDAPAEPCNSGSVSFSALLMDARVQALLAVGVLNQVGHGPYYVFFSIHMADAGYDGAVIGPLWAVGVLAEIVIFYFMVQLLPRFGLRRLLLVALGLTALRWTLVAWFAGNPIIMVLSQTLHAASYGVVHAVMIHCIHSIFSGRTQSSGQALYAAATFGVGGALGSLYAGYAWSALGPEYTYLSASLFPVLAFVIAFVLLRDI